jgi:hypothetical protein
MKELKDTLVTLCIMIEAYENNPSKQLERSIEVLVNDLTNERECAKKVASLEKNLTEILEVIEDYDLEDSQKIRVITKIAER